MTTDADSGADRARPRGRRGVPAVLIGAMAGLTIACTESLVDPLPDDSEAAVAVRIALYEALATDHGSANVAGYCVSLGDGDWTGRQDPPSDVLASLAETDPRFVAGSTCTVSLNGTVTAEGEPALLLHIERMERNGVQAQGLVFYQRTPLEAGSYDCTVRLNGSAWMAEACTSNADSDLVGLHAAAYLKLRELSSSFPNVYAFCLTEGEGQAQRDPTAAVLFRLQGAPRPIVGGSTCTWHGNEFRAPGGRSAMALHLERVEHGGDEAAVSGFSQDHNWLPRFVDCALTKDGRMWTVQTCESNNDPGGSPDDDLDIRVALYRNLITLEGSAGTSVSCLSEGSWTDVRDAPADVLGRLSGSGGSFVAASTCTIEFEGTFSQDGDAAQLLHIQSMERHHGYARAGVVYQRNGLDAGGFTCELEKQGGNWIVSGCRQDIRHDIDGKSIAVYRALSAASPFGTPSAYCMSNTFTAGVIPDDPREAVMFRLGGTERRFVAASSCISNGDVRYTATGEPAHTLHITTLGASTAVGVYTRDGQGKAVFDCPLVKEGEIWTASCTRRAESALTEDDIGVLVAAYQTLAAWVEPAYPERPKDAFCVGEKIGLDAYLRDPAPAVMERLAAADRRFVNGSACRLSADIRTHQGLPPLVFYLSGVSDWGWPLLVSDVTWQDGIATTTVAFSFSVPDTRGYTCRWEKSDGEWKLLSCSDGWIT